MTVVSLFLDIENLRQHLAGVSRVMVGVSGGPDSMALCHILSQNADALGLSNIDACIVDHDLRAESAQEAQETFDVIKNWSKVTPHILLWQHNNPESALQEKARQARHNLFQSFAKQHEVKHVFLAHHMDDQAETLLFRLAKGSGLKGLSGMQQYQSMQDLTIVRPLLHIEKTQVLKYCNQQDIPFVIDPSNKNTDFARVRLRQSRDILSEEGLTSKRLKTVSDRLGRADQALDFYAKSSWDSIEKSIDTDQVVFILGAFVSLPHEISFRLLQKATDHLRSKNSAVPRMEKLEALHQILITEKDVKPRTLGGLIFSANYKANEIHIKREEKLVS